MEFDIWEKILSHASNHRHMFLLSQSKGNEFYIEAIGNDFIEIRFTTNNKLKIEKNRFLSAYKHLEAKTNNWVLIGASRVETKPETLEGQIKMDYNGKMNGLSTAPWVAAILVNAFDNIVFNNKKKDRLLC